MAASHHGQRFSRKDFVGMQNNIARIRFRPAWRGGPSPTVVVLLLALVLGLVPLSACERGDPLVEARSLLRRGQTVESLEILRELIDEGRQDPELLFVYGRALMESGQPSLAEWPLREAMRDDDWFERAAMQLAHGAIAGGNMDNAGELLGRVLERNPENLEARMLLANAYARSPRHFTLALEEVDRILERRPDELQAFQPRILAHLGLNQPEEADAALAELGERIEQGAGDEAMRGWYCATMAIFANDKGDEALARERWADCNERFPAHPNVVARSVEFYDEHREFERALEIARAAFEIDPSPELGFRNLVSQHLQALGRRDEAEALLREGTEVEGQDARAQAWLALSEHYEQVGNYAAAADAVVQALEILRGRHGPQPALLFSLADLLILAGEDERALALTDEMTVAAHRALVLGRVAQNRGRHAEALEQYDEATRLWPDNPYALYHAGRAALALGEVDAALERFRSSARVSLSATDAVHQTARILSAEGSWRSAHELLGQAQNELSAEAELLRIELVGRFQGPEAAWKAAGRFSSRHPARMGEAVARVVDLIGRVQGAEAAWTRIAPVVDDAIRPRQRVAVLEAALRWAPADERERVAEAIAELVAASPELAAVRALDARLREDTGDRKGAIARYREALERQPDQPAALLGLARLLVDREPGESRALLEQALAGDGLDADVFLGVLRRLELDDGSERIELLGRALQVEPTSGALALELATRLEERDETDPRVLELARRAVRFRAGEEAELLLSRARGKPGPHGGG